MENKYEVAYDAKPTVSSEEYMSRRNEALSVRASLKGHLADTQTP
jgi:hypothetical protein